MLPQLQPSVFALHAFDPEPVLTHEAADRADRAQVLVRAPPPSKEGMCNAGAAGKETRFGLTLS